MGVAHHERDAKDNKRRKEASARRQPINAVNQIKGVGDSDDPQNRRQITNDHWKMYGVEIGKREIINAPSHRVEDCSSDNQCDELDARVRTLDVVIEP